MNYMGTVCVWKTMVFGNIWQVLNKKEKENYGD
jgi:hypothetical protein